METLVPRHIYLLHSQGKTHLFKGLVTMRVTQKSQNPLPPRIHQEIESSDAGSSALHNPWVSRDPIKNKSGR